jgi:hypothetical protein
MKKFIRYKRINNTFTAEGIQEQFDNIIKLGGEIVYYSEFKQDSDRMLVTIVYGVYNFVKK